MRIAHVLRRLSFDDWGGTEQVVWNIAKAQKAAGHDVRLFATTVEIFSHKEHREHKVFVSFVFFVAKKRATHRNRRRH